MDIPGYDFDWHRVKQEAENASKIYLRLPPGLIRYGPDIIDYISRWTHTSVELLTNSCYGACDYPPSLFVTYCKKNEKIFHFGDTAMPSLHPPSNILFFEAKSTHSVTTVVSQAVKDLEGDKIGLVTTTPWIHALPQCKKILKNQGYFPIIGKGGNRTVYDGQVLGCDLTSAETIASSVDSFLYIGDGLFHPLGVTLATQKPVIAADPCEQRVKKQEIHDLKDTILRQRNGALANASEAETFGILLCQKIGQNRPHVATHLKELIEKNGKRGYYLSLDTVSPHDIDDLKIDCYVSTACPRIAIDDSRLYKKPILTPIELEILFGERDWSTYEFDQIL